MRGLGSALLRYVDGWVKGGEKGRERLNGVEYDPKEDLN